MSRCLDVFFCGFPASGKSTAWERFVERHKHECTRLAVRVTEEDHTAGIVDFGEERSYLSPVQLGWVKDNGEKLYVSRPEFDRMKSRGMFIKDDSARNKKRIDHKTDCRRATLHQNEWPDPLPHHLYRAGILGPRLVLYFNERNIMLENAVVLFFTGREQDLRDRIDRRPKDGSNATRNHHLEVLEEYLKMGMQQTFEKAFGKDCIIDSSSLNESAVDLAIDERVTEIRASIIARRG